jgi:hypothetical protein
VSHPALVNGEPMYGPRDSDEESGWYQPDWALCAERARELLRRVQAAPDGHRRKYDLDRVREFVQLIEACARPECAGDCWMSISY